MTRSQRYQHRPRPDYTKGLEDDGSNNGNDSIYSSYSKTGSDLYNNAKMDLNPDHEDDDMELDGGGDGFVHWGARKRGSESK